METEVDLFESLLEQTELYSRTSYELGKLRTLETTTHIVTSLISRSSVIIMISLFSHQEI